MAQTVVTLLICAFITPGTTTSNNSAAIPNVKIFRECFIAASITVGFDWGLSLRIEPELPDKLQSERHVPRIGLNTGNFAERAAGLMHQVDRAVRVGR